MSASALLLTLATLLPLESPASTLLRYLSDEDSPVASLFAALHGQLDRVGAACQQVPFAWIIVAHAIATSAGARAPALRRYWLLCFWTAFLSGYGGGTITSLIMQEPLIWLRDDWVLSLFALCWWIIVYCPFDIGFRTFSLTPVKLSIRAFNCLSRTGVMLARIDSAVRIFGGTSLLAPLVIGTLAGCGGRSVLDVILTCLSSRHPEMLSCVPPNKPEMLFPSWISRSALLITLFYTVTVHWTASWTRNAAYGAICSVLICHSTMEVASGRPWDATAFLEAAFHRLTGIPNPQQLEQFQAPAKASDCVPGNDQTLRTRRSRGQVGPIEEHKTVQKHEENEPTRHVNGLKKRNQKVTRRA